MVHQKLIALVKFRQSAAHEKLIILEINKKKIWMSLGTQILDKKVNIWEGKNSKFVESHS